MVVSWVAQSEVAQVLEDHLGYNKPCLITWVNHSASVLLLPVLYFGHVLEQGGQGDGCRGWLSALSAQGVSPRLLLRVSAKLAVLYLLGDLLWYVGLATVSVAAGTAIFNSSCAVTYVLSVAFLGTRVAVAPLGFIALVLAGVMLVALGGQSTHTTHAGGDGSGGGGGQLVGSVLVFAAASCYAAFEVGLALVLKQNVLPSSADVVNLFSFGLGAFNLVAMWPLLALLTVLPRGAPLHEPFRLPDGAQLGFLLLNAALALSFNVSFMLAVAFTSPVLASVCCVTTIPLAMATDALLWGRELTPLEGGGCAMIACGFFALAVWEDRAAASPSSPSPVSMS